MYGRIPPERKFEQWSLILEEKLEQALRRVTSLYEVLDTRADGVAAAAAAPVASSRDRVENMVMRAADKMAGQRLRKRKRKRNSLTPEILFL